MRDLAEKWPAPPAWPNADLAWPGLAIRTVSGLCQSFVSGDLDAWHERHGTQGPGVGALALATGDVYTVRLARDRLLRVGTRPLTTPAGWHREGFAVTAIDAGLHVFELRGSALPDLLSRATTLPPDTTSPSAALLFAGVNAIAYRHGDTDTLRLHVDRGLAAHLWEWFDRAARPAV